MDRRNFLYTAGAATGLAISGTGRTAFAAPGRGTRVAVIGVRSQGWNHVKSLGDRVVAMCDVDSAVLERRAAEYETGNDGKKIRSVERFHDYRDLLERADVDAVSIATPNHTHSLIAIAAIEGGKDVYVEKPVSHNVWEGRQLVAAAQKHKRIVQTGTQSRSNPSLRAAAEWVHNGALGEVRYAIGTCYKPRKPIGKLSEAMSIPTNIDYDLWCGPAEKRELFRPTLHYDWHWDWNTGNGDMGNQGIHQMDIARWFLGEENLAPRTISIGGRLGYDDAGDTPNTQVVYHAYERAPLIFETRGLPRSKAAQAKWGDSMDRFRGSDIGVVVQCEEGHVLVPSYGEAIAYNRRGEIIKRWNEWVNHHENWLAAVEARDPSLLSAPIREGHVSSALCHTGGVSHQIGEKASAVDIAREFASNPLLSGAFERMASHLRANGVDIDETDEALTLGPWLEVDTEAERFVDNNAANALITRAYRSPYTISSYEA